MLNVGTPEMLVILVVALLVLGPNKLPEVARQVGRAVGEIRRLGAGFQAEMRDALQEPVKMEPVEPDTSEPDTSEPDTSERATPEPPTSDSDTPAPEPDADGVAPGWSPEEPADNEAVRPDPDPEAEVETTAVPPVDGTQVLAPVNDEDEPPAGIAPV
ncbi:MAG: twin-arginine translocation protein tatb [Acidimicrobiales bacterium]|nr:twin-arginine translocation protein tatb [Acidimicrobiales bacterium]